MKVKNSLKLSKSKTTQSKPILAKSRLSKNEELSSLEKIETRTRKSSSAKLETPLRESIKTSLRKRIETPQKPNSGPKSAKKKTKSRSSEKTNDLVSISENSTLNGSTLNGSTLNGSTLNGSTLNGSASKSECRFSCDQCNYVGKKNSQLKTHKFSNHLNAKERRKVAPYKCDICLYCCFAVNKLTSHLRSVHKKPILDTEKTAKKESDGNIPTSQSKVKPQTGTKPRNPISCRECQNFQCFGLKELFLHMEEVHGRYMVPQGLSKVEENLSIRISGFELPQDEPASESEIEEGSKPDNEENQTSD